MNNFKNEKGAALVLTLMIITLFLIYILAQFTQVTNTTKQVTTMEKQIDTQLIAEMGIDYYQQKIGKQKEGFQQILDDNDNQRLLEEIETFNSELQKEIRIDDDRSFELTITPAMQKDNKIVIEFSSKGTSSKQTETIESSVVIDIE